MMMMMVMMMVMMVMMMVMMVMMMDGLVKNFDKALFLQFMANPKP
jgi:hypothetical protein